MRLVIAIMGGGKYFLRIVYSMFCWGLFALMPLLYAFFLLLTVGFVKDKPRYALRLNRVVLGLSFCLCGVRSKLMTREEFPDFPVLIVCNHQSLFDVVFGLAIFPSDVLFFAKEELKNIPLLGWLTVFQKHILVARKKIKTSKRQLQTISQRVSEGYSVLVFPEGTRSKDDCIGPFKRGAFMLALEYGIPILPCYIHNTGKILHKSSWLFRPGKAVFVAGSVIKVPHVGEKQRKEQALALMDEARAAILNLQASLSG